MYKVTIKLIVFIFLMLILVACSSAKKELTVIHNDLIDNVKEPIVQIRADMDEYEDNVLSNPNISGEEDEEYSKEYTTYLEQDMIRVLDTNKEYLHTYKEPRTDEGKTILAAYTSTYEAYFNLLEENGQFLISLLANDLIEDDFDTFDQKLAAIDAQITHELDELNLLFSEYSKEFSIIFIDPLY